MSSENLQTDRSDASLNRALEVAKTAARKAAEVSMQHFMQPIEVERKADASPVTEADRACEQLIRDLIQAEFPEHAIFGEEFGHSGTHRCLWLIDPIDGTRSFIRHLEFWSVQIALMVDETIVIGVSAAPPFDELAWAVKGQGAWIEPLAGSNEQAARRLQVAETCEIDQMDWSLGNVRSLAKNPTHWSQVGALVERASRTRGYGDFYPYHRLAAGGLDVVVESDVNILDIAALSLIVEEAGGIMTALDGAPIGLGTRAVLAGTSALHQQLLEHFND